jgi:hypothetical protein
LINLYIYIAETLTINTRYAFMATTPTTEAGTGREDLAAINSAALGAKFPEITLPDGSKVQTGTVG